LNGPRTQRHFIERSYEYLDQKNRLAIYNKDGEQTYPMMGRVPLTDLASWQEEGDRRGVVWVTIDWGWGREKINDEVKAYSGSRLI
jgi:hypothetical protein